MIYRIMKINKITNQLQGINQVSIKILRPSLLESQKKLDQVIKEIFFLKSFFKIYWVTVGFIVINEENININEIIHWEINYLTN